MKESRIFKNCSVIYLKKKDTSLLNNIKGKIIISDFPEFNRICSVKGLIHILNLNSNNIPNGKIDCIICGSRDEYLEEKIRTKGYDMSIIYLNSNEKWCGMCKKLGPLDEGKPITKFCSEKCMRKSVGFVNKKAETIKDLHFSGKTIIRFDKSVSEKKKGSHVKTKSREKFQSSMVKEALRLEYAKKREEYKKEMKQPSLRKVRISSEKRKVSNTVTKQCKSVTKKGKNCTNKAVSGGEYCGIVSHKKCETT